MFIICYNTDPSSILNLKMQKKKIVPANQFQCGFLLIPPWVPNPFRFHFLKLHNMFRMVCFHEILV